MTHQHPVLLQIIIANSALRMSNAYQKFPGLDSTISCFSHSASLSKFSSSSYGLQQSQTYHDALSAKQRALHLLSCTLNSRASENVDVTLAVVLLFIEFELIDTGRDNWRHHLNGAITIIESLCSPEKLNQTTTHSLRSFLISNCLVYV